MKPNGTRSGQGASGEGFATVRVLRCLLLVCLASLASVASVAAADATTLSETLLVAGPGPSEPMPALEYYARRIDEVAASFGELPGALHEALWRPHGEPIPGGPGRLAFAAGVLLVSGMCVMWAVSRALSMLRVRIETSSGAAPRTGRFVRAIPRLMLDGFEVGAFGLGVLVAYVVMQPPHSVAAPLLNEVLIASLAILALSRVSRLLFAPRRAELRLLSMSDQAAGTWCRSLVTIGAIVMVLAAVGRGLGILGVDRDQLTALGIPLSLIPFSLLGVTFWRHRKSMRMS